MCIPELQGNNEELNDWLDSLVIYPPVDEMLDELFYRECTGRSFDKGSEY